MNVPHSSAALRKVELFIFAMLEANGLNNNFIVVFQISDLLENINFNFWKKLIEEKKFEVKTFSTF